MPIDVGKFINPTTNTKSSINLEKFGITKMMPTVKPVEQPDMSAFSYTNNSVGLPTNNSYQQPATQTANSSVAMASLPDVQRAQQSTSQIMSIPQNAYHDFVNKLGDSISAYKNYDASSGGFSKALAANLQTGSAAANVIFSPISMAATALEKTPGPVGSATGLVNKVFKFGGDIASTVATKTLGALPIDQQTKDTLMPAINDVGNLIGQIIVAHGASVLGGKIMPREAVNEIHQDFVNNVADLAQNHEGEITSDVAKGLAAQAGEQTVTKLRQAGDQLLLPEKATPSIGEVRGPGFVMKEPTETELKLSKATQKYQEALDKYNQNPTPELRENVLAKKDKVTQYTSEKQISDSTPKIDVSKFVPEDKLGEPATTPELPQTIPGEQFQPKLAGDVIKGFQDKGLLPPDYENLPTAERITFEDQLNKTSELLNNDLDRAKSILRGDEPLPSNMRSPFLLEGARELVEKTGDAELAHIIANSPLLSGTSVHAQEVGAMRIMNPDSVATQFAEVRSARESNAAKTQKTTIDKVKNETVNQIKSEVKKTVPKIKDWNEFLDKLKCQ